MAMAMAMAMASSNLARKIKRRAKGCGTRLSRWFSASGWAELADGVVGPMQNRSARRACSRIALPVRYVSNVIAPTHAPFRPSSCLTACGQLPL